MERRPLEEDGDDRVAASPAECVAMVWALTLDSWASARAEIPDYARAEAPGRLLRRRGS
jgi:hypothetical protein